MHARWEVWLERVLTVTVFVIFGLLALRHVGDSFFLADQADQLQNFERLQRLEPFGLWGPVMSGTNPPARALGPLGALVFGVPVRAGLGVDGVHATTSLVLVASTVVAFVALARASPPLAWAWLILFGATGIVWWNAAMLWANTVLLPAGCVVLALIVGLLRRPTLTRIAALLLFVLLAAQVHLVALTALAPVATAALVTGRRALRIKTGRGAAAGLTLAALVVLGPYVLAESMTGLGNTNAMLGHLAEARTKDMDEGVAAAMQVLQLAADPTGVLERAGTSSGLTFTLAGLAAALALFLWRNATPERTILWLTMSALVGVLAQALFFILVNRPLFGLHYVAVLAPMYVVPPAALAAWVIGRVASLPQRTAGLAMASAALVLLVWRGPSWADAHQERTEWTYTNLVGAIDALCDSHRFAATIEGPGFAAFTPGNDGVLKFLMTRGFAGCRYDESSSRMLVAARDGRYTPTLDDRGRRYELVSVVPPGIALYDLREAAR